VVSHGSSGSTGRSGSSGSGGSTGHSGASSHPGHDAVDAHAGAISFAVLDKGGAVIETAGTCYSLAVTGYVIDDVQLDCVFEPGERFRIGQVSVVNQGGIACPAGAVLSFPSTSTAFFSGQNSYVLPAITAGGSLVVSDFFFEGALYDVPSPVAPGPFSGHASFVSAVEMLGRPFLDGAVASQVEMSYPVRFGQVQVVKQMGLGETSRVSISVRNLSTLPLGGLVTVRVELAPCIVAAGLLGTTLSFPLATLDGNSTQELAFDVVLRNDAQLFEQYPWKAFITLRGKARHVRWIWFFF
jgi:hypothetical protein